MLCDYGCGKEANYKFKNGKWCCEKRIESCSGHSKKIKEKFKQLRREKPIVVKSCEYCGKEHNCSYGSGRFCTVSCARKHASNMFRETINEKVSAKLRNKEYCSEKNIYELECLCCGGIFKKEIHITAYEAKRFNCICDTCRKTVVGKNMQLPAFKFWLGLRKKDRTVAEKKNKLSWNELSLSWKRKKIAEEQNHKCICGIDEWNDQPLSLQLHHIDGDKKNTSRENLQILCPNCHTQTDTYGIKSLMKRKPGTAGKKLISDEDLLKCLLESKSIIAAVRKAGITDTRRARKLLTKYFEVNAG